MKYADKIQFAEQAARQLSNNVSLTEVKSELKSKGLYEADIKNVLVSARNVMLEELSPVIRERLLNNQPINRTIPEFANIEEETLKKLIERGLYTLEMEQRNIAGELIRAGVSGNQIKETINMNFYSVEKLNHQIDMHNAQGQEESSGSRGLYMVIAIIFIVIKWMIIFNR